ncbi:hypothetical protein K6L44_13355 [Gluconacetobacter entanii]|uniref:hypothetical protein n=1 Tax=Gluconacetobacter entanii TaxID=108528 RepID=UPI001C935648|nr:hypothetical protein [Gluconacetobacter entanii]MBY4640949.1 hypothetical protein [Gluconacetobacter entanii]MCW4579040.1 hypothetical protein [Gluconacetobacter entanii]MCW4582440.1 hypothetical protein [Gluconacetobacter entanii]MCW4585829.1 hypothetical protein [Gluconacetobacter entanii]
MKLDLTHVAFRYITKYGGSNATFSNYRCVVNAQTAIEIATWYHNVHPKNASPDALELYRKFREETFRQYEFLVASGLKVEAWLRKGQPYRNARHLRAEVEKSGILYVYLTRRGYGSEYHGVGQNIWADGCSSALMQHPMTELTGVRASNIDLMYNDLFRAVHDVFGHLMFEASFSIEGEFLAAREHSQMYSQQVFPVLFAETVGQICWYYSGPHRTRGHPVCHDSRGQFISDDIPYAPQKTALMPVNLIELFLKQFSVVGPVLCAEKIKPFYGITSRRAMSSNIV